MVKELKRQRIEVTRLDTKYILLFRYPKKPGGLTVSTNIWIYRLTKDVNKKDDH